MVAHFLFLPPFFGMKFFSKVTVEAIGEMTSAFEAELVGPSTFRQHKWG